MFTKILFVVLIIVSVSFAQEKIQQEKKSGQVEQEKKTQPANETVKAEKQEVKFIDQNGDGIDDTKQRKGKMKKKGKMDTFEDKDGDGINDNRCQGMGWGKGSRKGYGKNSR